jgi:hypothetical protein
LTSFDSFTFCATTPPSDAGVVGDLLERRLDGAADDVDADLLVLVLRRVSRTLLSTLAAARMTLTPPPGRMPFLDRGAAGVQGVLDAGLLLLHRPLPSRRRP